jgi:hypothetical protein
MTHTTSFELRIVLNRTGIISLTVRKMTQTRKMVLLVKKVLLKKPKPQGAASFL